MRKTWYAKLLVLVAVLSLSFCLSASANPAIVSYGGSYSSALASGQTYEMAFEAITFPSRDGTMLSG
ncbi:hypothetical protein IDH44_15190 [Paenibacillus sp. IB182496]|uniref:Uncharacterized protein n=1 Tax=Paenibacillus sabuli TaxID=2772509 RepID=A0A927BW15_9BACL|nr:hypothetical protein [Paenibacillus sabuli]MBD2846544.1 hypothetical protein [Paenibacillus sabuli]